jgi:protein ImuB
MSGRRRKDLARDATGGDRGPRRRRRMASSRGSAPTAALRDAAENVGGEAAEAIADLDTSVSGSECRANDLPCRSAAFAGRIACIDVPALPLQLLLRREPSWRRHPSVVVDADRPQGRILWLNERAYRSGVRTGQRYAAGLSLCAGLRAGVVEPAEITAAVDALVALLRRFSPRVEPDPDEPGVLRADLDGLAGVFASPTAWATGLAAELRAAGWRTIVGVGFDRFRVHALTRALAAEGLDLHVCADRAEEIARTDGVPLARLHVDPRLRDALERLGLTDVGDLRVLPPGGLLARFGADGARLQGLVADGGGGHADLVAADECVRFHARFELEPDEPSIDTSGLLFVIKQRLGRLLEALAARGEAAAALTLDLLLDPSLAPKDATRVHTALKPAEPTLDAVQLVDLIRLRLEMLDLAAPIVGFELELEPVPASRAQLELFGEEASRDLRAADRALARLRAEFGEDAVVRARLRPGHLPEATFAWERLERLGRARTTPARASETLFDLSPDPGSSPHPSSPSRLPVHPSAAAAPTAGAADAGAPDRCDEARLVRRFLARPRGVQGPGLDPDGGWFVAGLDAGTVQGLHGPYVVSGGWWRSVPGAGTGSEGGTAEVHREYHFAETRRGDVLWLFRDRGQSRWFVQAVLE